jgi:hypothetical protein
VFLGQVSDWRDQNKIAFGDAHREHLVLSSGCHWGPFGGGIPGPGHAVYQRTNGRSGWQQGALEVVHPFAEKKFNTPSGRIPAWKRPRYSTGGFVYSDGPQVRAFKQCNGEVPVWDGRQHWLTTNY